MNDEELDRVLGRLPFGEDEGAPPDEETLARLRAGEALTEVEAALVESAAARALLEASEEAVDPFTVRRLRGAVFPRGRRWIVPLAAGVAVAAGLLLFALTRPEPAPAYQAPRFGGTLAEVRAPGEAPARLIYPRTGRIRMTVSPVRALAEPPPLRVYAVTDGRLAPVAAEVEALEDGVYEVGVEVSALPGEGPRQVVLLTVLGDGADALEGATPDPDPGPSLLWFRNEVEVR